MGGSFQQLHGDIQCGQKTDLLLGGRDEHAFAQCALRKFAGGDIDLQTEHQAHTGDAADAGRGLQRAAEIVRALAHAFEQPVVDAAEDVHCACAADGVAAERRAVVAGVEDVCHTLAEHGHAEGQTAADALCRGDDVGLQTVVHIAVEAAAAAVAELDLVCHEQQGPNLSSLYPKS